MYKRLSRFMQHLATSGKSSKTGKYSNPVPERLKRAFYQQFPIGGRVTDKNKGGYVVEIDGFNAFCPFSEMYQPDILLLDKHNIKNNKCVFEFTVIEISARSCTLSRIKALKIRTIGKINKSIADKTPLEGKVKTIKPYGAFIDLGGIEGLLHISELQNRIKGTSGVFLKPNDTISVYVINIDNSTEKISLSTQKPVTFTNRILEVVS